jgi:UDP-2,3-diacylglucosamine pyrophosphatase LpxH
MIATVQSRYRSTDLRHSPAVPAGIVSTDRDVEMLVIISDLHLTDGTSGTSLPPGAFAIFAERLQDLAERASWRAGGAYQPIERLDVILLGDIVDAIRSNVWLDRGRVRPWDDPQSPEYIDTIEQITLDTLDNNDEGLLALRSLAEGAIRLPPATRDGRPVVGAESLPVEVRIFYMVGNHDWFYHLPGAKYDAIRRTIVDRLGLAQPFDSVFPHDPLENGDLIDTLRRHHVMARHGDVYDPFNFEGDRDASSLGDAIVVELVNRFAREVDRELSEDLPAAVLAGLREIDNIRPILLIPVWIDGLLERSCPVPALRKRVKQIWDQMSDDFLSLNLVRERDTLSPFDLVDGLERALKFTKRLSLGWASAVSTWLAQLRGNAGDSYWRHALAEQDFRNRRAKHIIYGHTHAPEIVSLDASYAEGYVHNQVYLNSGTWRRVHRQTMFAPNEHEFIASDSMTYLAFFQGDERGGRPYESWSGTLGVNLPEGKILRVDSAHSAARRPHVVSSGKTVAPRSTVAAAANTAPVARLPSPGLQPRPAVVSGAVGRPAIVPTRRV